jgi:anti-sigma-K factor RskA
MDIKKYIASGILELYVAGSLSEKENEQVFEIIQEYPELLSEIREIEKTVSTLTSSVAPKESETSFKNLLIKMVLEKETTSTPKVIPIDRSKTNWVKYSGWAASIVIGSTLLFTLLNNSDLTTELETVASEKQQFEQQLEDAKTDLSANETLLSAIRVKDIITVPLQGQAVSPDSYAKIYWNKSNNTIYVDVQGLPDPPAGKVYQLWSLKLNPLTPTSLGTIDDFITDTNKIFTIDNPNESQAFGITLEPAGGSESPNLEQLYTLGAVSS